MTKPKKVEAAPAAIDYLAAAKAQSVTPDAPALSVIALALIAIAERLPANTTNVVQRIEHRIVDDNRFETPDTDEPDDVKPRKRGL